MTTLVAFVDAIEDLKIAGVTHQWKSGPPLGDPGDIPCSFVNLAVTGANGPQVFGEQGKINPALRCELVVALEPVGQDVGDVNFDACIAMMDAVTTAIMSQGNCWPGASKCTWATRVEIVPIAGIDFWCVVTTIEGR
jgi:hypothetical protein